MTFGELHSIAARSIEVPATTPELRPADRERGVEALGGFANVLRELTVPVIEAHADVNHELDRLLTGESTDLHSIQIAMQKSELNFQMMLQVRNKMLQAYREIIQMQV